MTTSGRRVRRSFNYSAALDEIEDMMNHPTLTDQTSPSSDGITFQSNSPSDSSGVSPTEEADFFDIYNRDSVFNSRPKKFSVPQYFPPMSTNNQQKAYQFKNGHQEQRYFPMRPQEKLDINSVSLPPSKTKSINNEGERQENSNLERDETLLVNDSRGIHVPTINQIPTKSSMKQANPDFMQTFKTMQAFENANTKIEEIKNQLKSDNIATKKDDDQVIKKSQWPNKANIHILTPKNQQEPRPNAQTKAAKIHQEPETEIHIQRSIIMPVSIQTSFPERPKSPIRSTIVTFVNAGKKSELTIYAKTTAFSLLSDMKLSKLFSIYEVVNGIIRRPVRHFENLYDIAMSWGTGSREFHCSDFPMSEVNVTRISSLRGKYPKVQGWLWVYRNRTFHKIFVVLRDDSLFYSDEDDDVCYFLNLYLQANDEKLLAKLSEWNVYYSIETPRRTITPISPPFVSKFILANNKYNGTDEIGIKIFCVEKPERYKLMILT